MPDQAEPGPLDATARMHLERWLLSQEFRDYMIEKQDLNERPSQTGPYIAISREAGAGGGHIARLVGQQLGWDVLDKELLDFMATRYQLRRDLLELVDETKAHLISDLLRSLFTADKISQDDYIIHLQRTLYLAAVHGKVVIVGRGAHCILPRERGFAVRIILPREQRVERMMDRRELGRDEAERQVEEIDAGRRELCQYYFSRDNDDPHLYDLVINVARFSAEMAATQIVEAYRSLYPACAVPCQL